MSRMQGIAQQSTSRKYDERSTFVTAPKPKLPEEEEVRPASPKYDERTLFYTTPQVALPAKGERSPFRRPAPKAAVDASAGKRKLESGASFRLTRSSKNRILILAIWQQQCCLNLRLAAVRLDSPFAKKGKFISQITGPSPLTAKSQTPVSQAGFKWKVAGKGQQLTLLSIEILADTRQEHCLCSHINEASSDQHGTYVRQ